MEKLEIARDPANKRKRRKKKPLNPAEYARQMTLRNAPPKIMTRAEAAEYTTVSLRKIADLIAKRELRAYKIGGRTMLRLEDINKKFFPA